MGMADLQEKNREHLHLRCDFKPSFEGVILTLFIETYDSYDREEHVKALMRELETMLI